MTNDMPPKEQFRFIANELHCQFPDLDLRFCFQEGTRTMRFMAAALSPDIHETVLVDNPISALYQTIFTVKQLAGIFDA